MSTTDESQELDRRLNILLKPTTSTLIFLFSFVVSLLFVFNPILALIIFVFVFFAFSLGLLLI